MGGCEKNKIRFRKRANLHSAKTWKKRKNMQGNLPAFIYIERLNDVPWVFSNDILAMLELKSHLFSEIIEKLRETASRMRDFHDSRHITASITSLYEKIKFIREIAIIAFFQFKSIPFQWIRPTPPQDRLQS